MHKYTGSLSKDEFIKAMKFLAPQLTVSDAKKLFRVIDVDNDQTISYTEFLAATLDPRAIDIEELNSVFELLDTDGNGSITLDELHKVCVFVYVCHVCICTFVLICEYLGIGGKVCRCQDSRR